jgi:DNA-binding CsgD family transcriptional regulator/tetratricopeptide (TPR) repeat protein
VPRLMSALVGRQAEVLRADTVLAAAFAGEPGAVVIDGDAGVGKTRLLTELTTRSAAPVVLLGHCVDFGDTPPPYLPLAEAFARLPLDDTSALVERHPAIARLLPDRAAGADDRIDRGAMLDAVLAALVQLAEQRPVLLVVEDLQWADIATRDLLGFLFTRMSDLPGVRLAVLATVRSDDLHRRHPQRTALAGWARLPAVLRLHLDPLPADDIRTLVQGRDAAIDEPRLADIVRRAGGNAFFAEELLDSIRHGGDQLPVALADLLLLRLEPLSAGARAVVDVAAVAGSNVAHDVLRDVVGRSHAVLDDALLNDALREAIDAHVLQAVPDPRGRPGYRFRHALLGEAVYDDLLPGELVRIHAAFVTALQATSDSDAADLARHARAAHDLPVAFEAAVRAAEQAMSVGAPFEAVEHLQTALEIVDVVPAPSTGRTQLLLSFVDAGIAAGRSRRAMRMVHAELDRLPDTAPTGERASLLYGFAQAATAGEYGTETSAALLDAMRLTADDPPSGLRARLAAMQARVASTMGRTDEALRLSQRAVELAEAAGAAAALIEAQATRATIQSRYGDLPSAIELLGRAADDAARTGDHATEVRARFSLATLYNDQGELRRAQDAYDRLHRRGRELGRRYDVFVVHALADAARMRFARGQWDDALALLTRSESAPAVSAAILDSTALRIHVGRGEADVLDQAAALRPFWTDEGQIAINAVFAVLPVLGRDARVDDAVALADEFVDVLGTLWMDPWFAARIELSALVLQVLARGAGSANEARRAELVATGRRFVDDAHTCVDRRNARTVGFGPEALAWLARADASWASLRWAAGVDAPSETDLLTAWRAAESATDYDENVVELARVRASLALVLRATGRKDDAAATADAARTVARSTGDVLVLDDLRSLSTPAPPTVTGPQPLTPRELDVLALVADGRTNRQIAARLFISEKTVSVHVSNILAKLGVQGRTEAAAVAGRDGLL